MNRPLKQVAKEIKADWRINIGFMAKDCLDFMECFDSIDEGIGESKARYKVGLFLLISNNYQTKKSDALKTELKQMLGI